MQQQDSVKIRARGNPGIASVMHLYRTGMDTVRPLGLARI